MFYTNQVQPMEVFDPLVHTRQDLKVFKVHMQHTEGNSPVAQLIIGQKHVEPGQRFFLAYEQDGTVHLMFAGRVQNAPRPVEGNLYQLDLVADSAMADVQVLKTPHKRFPHWDPLFLSASQQDKLQGLVPHYSRTDGTVRMVDPFQRPATMDNLNGHFYQDTLTVHQKHGPHATIHVEVTAEWVQRYHGLTDISHMLVRELPDHRIDTLTAEDFQKRWWRPQQMVKRTGYKVVQAQLTPVHQGSSAAFMVGDHEVTLPCHGLEPTLVVEWNYRQKRREVIRCTLQNLDPSAVGEHTLRFHLQDITADTVTPHWQTGVDYTVGHVVQYGDQSYGCLYAHRSGTHFTANRSCWEPVVQRQCALDAPWRSSFFTTPRGQQAFEHALYQARCLMLQQRRTGEITFSMPLNQGLHLDIGQGIQLTDALQGQVTGYAFLLDGATGAMEARVTLAQTGHYRPLGEISYKPYGDQLPCHGILQPQNLRAEDLVKAVLYKNMAGVQNELLRGQTFLSMTAVQALLAQNRTAVQIHLQDLVSSDVLDHGIVVETVQL
jgi:hypothetical protein